MEKGDAMVEAQRDAPVSSTGPGLPNRRAEDSCNAETRDRSEFCQ